MLVNKNNEDVKYFDEKYGVAILYSPELINPLSIPKEYRASVLGTYFETPEEANEALQDFYDDDKPNAKKVRRGMLAMVLQFEAMERKEKRRFLDEFSEKVGLSTLLIGANGDCFSMILVLSMLEPGDELLAIFVAGLMSGMSNKGPDSFKQYVDSQLRNNASFVSAVHMISDKPMAIQGDISNKAYVNNSINR